MLLEVTLRGSYKQLFGGRGGGGGGGGGRGSLAATALSVLSRYLHAFIVNYLSTMKYLFKQFYAKYLCL